MEEIFPFIISKIERFRVYRPNIQKMMFDYNIETKMTLTESKAMVSFKEVVTMFISKKNDPHYISVSDIVKKFKKLECLMSLKIRFLNSHLNFFSDNMYVSDEQCEKFHKVIKMI